MRERLTDILRLVAKAHPARDVSGAWKILDEAFEKVENRLPGHRMYVHAISAFEEVSHAGKKAYVDIYNRHTLLLGENGSIEVRLTDPNVLGPTNEKSGRPFEHLKVILEKAGADGGYLWD